MARVGSLMALIWVIGCGGDDGTPLAPEAGRMVMAATIDGVVFTADRVFGGLFGDSLDLSGFAVDGSLGLTALNVTGPGTFSLEARNWRSAMGRVTLGSVLFLTSEGSGSGTLTLSTVTPRRISGTFSFVAYDYSWDPPWGGVVPVMVESGIIDIHLP